MNVKTIKSAAQAGGFYDIPIYKIGDEKPDYFNLFDWGGDVIGKCLVENRSILGSSVSGKLKEELFDSIDKKIAYLQGVFGDSCEGAGITRGENYLLFANSNNKVERCKRWINEAARFMGGVHVFGVLEHNIKYLIPISHKVIIEPKVVQFILNYNPIV